MIEMRSGIDEGSVKQSYQNQNKPYANQVKQYTNQSNEASPNASTTIASNMESDKRPMPNIPQQQVIL